MVTSAAVSNSSGLLRSLPSPGGRRVSVEGRVVVVVVVVVGWGEGCRGTEILNTECYTALTF